MCLPPRSSPGRRSDGFASIQFVAAAGLCLVVLTMVANLVVMQYARGTVRAALDEGVRAGAPAGAAAADCITRARGVVDDLLGGAIGRSIALTCDVEGDRVVARAVGAVDGWLPIVPDLRLDLVATAVKETLP